METASLLAIISGTCWAINITIVKWALNRSNASALIGATVGVTIAAFVSLALAISSGSAVPDFGIIWKFALVGIIAPGSSQGLFVSSIGAIGPSRTSILIGTSPVFSVLLAVVFLDESWKTTIMAGTLLTVIGGAMISWEKGTRFRNMGILFALSTSLTFAIRDVVARHFNIGTDVSSWWSGTIVLVAAAVTLWIFVFLKFGSSWKAQTRKALPEFIPSGIMIGIALPLLLEALNKGTVNIVAPLALAAQNVVIVILSGWFFGARERTSQVLIAMILIFLGGLVVTVS
jgi:drug/metabolite transporter (DMT)-like permease|tara:strand:- start:47214 stop:48077 length:864 start_codon:yes stop_codon:yes gene_type:complete